MTKSTRLCITAILEEAERVTIRNRDELLEENKRLRNALQEIADLNFVISLPDRMDAVRRIAREALQ